MKQMSATDIGKVLGKTAREVNLLLKDKGFLDGAPGNYDLTDLGNKFGKVFQYNNGGGGYAKRIRSYIWWDENIIDKLKK